MISPNSAEIIAASAWAEIPDVLGVELDALPFCGAHYVLQRRAAELAGHGDPGEPLQPRTAEERSKDPGARCIAVLNV